MRRSAFATLLVACLSAAAFSVPGAPGPGIGSAACAAPYIDTEPRQAQPGASLTVRGDYHLDACHDTGEPRKAGALSDLPVIFAKAASSPPWVSWMRLDPAAQYA